MERDSEYSNQLTYSDYQKMYEEDNAVTSALSDSLIDCDLYDMPTDVELTDY